MLSRPADLTDAAIRRSLDEHWHLSPHELAYEPVGFGSHHWITEDHFVSLDRAEVVASLGAALRTATALRDDGGLAFVIAPIPTASGALLAPVTDGWVMHLYPRLTIVDSTQYGPHTDPGVVEIVQAIHASTPVAARHAESEDFSISERDDLEKAVDDLDEPWDTGPYGERARRLLAAHAEDVMRLLDVHDSLVAEVPRDGWVVTHGEPHRGNVFRTTQGWAVVDWDTALLAPPARDLWNLPADCDARLGQLYRLRWDLTEIAVYISEFYNSHSGDPNDDQSWAGLVTHIDARGRWPQFVHPTSGTTCE
jgi:spectinomycin phosphotransferase